MSDGEMARSESKEYIGQNLTYRRDGVEIVPAVIDGLSTIFWEVLATTEWRSCS
ncbi:hypothetical protein BVRB_035090 [Beta vulgaris subsp. vulgaris]|uniref:Uncharacterized protein n=1 Tax=Beta vulgaris subsp. vulgaris TaxID=3555 RepID=A0A0J7YPN8_BETVV|nr:hypothetical protein BVRB_035090 [Beta vulgaris subsp. vulgaris]